MAIKKKKEFTKYNTLPVSNIKNESQVKIPVSDIKENRILFSYKHFICDCAKGKDFTNCFKDLLSYAKWITLCIKKLSEISTMTLAEVNSSGSSLRFHSVEGKNLIKLKEILLSLGVKIDDIFSQAESSNYYQLSLGTANGRIFGYLIGNVFFVLLMDPHHLIYPCLEKGSTQDLLYTRYNPWKELFEC